jgi:hypothetical protein
MAYVAFEPDPEYSEYEFGYGNFLNDKGERRYGYDPDLAKSLKLMPPQADALTGPGKTPITGAGQRLAQNDEALSSLDRSAPMSSAPNERADVPASLDTQYQDMAPKASQPARAPSSADGMPTAPGGDQRTHELAGIPGIDKTSPEFRAELTKTASEMGVSPRALAGIMSFESGFSPSVQSGGDAGKDAHAGLIQFSRANFADVARTAGQPEMTWDEMRQLTPEQQLPFVKAYYQLHGVQQGASGGDLYMATFAPAYKDKPDDAVLYDKDTARGVRTTDSNRRLDTNDDGFVNGYEQNPGGLDENHDGKITAGEVRARGERYGDGQGRAEPNMSLADPSLGEQSLDYRGGDQLRRMGQGGSAPLDALGQPTAPGMQRGAGGFEEVTSPDPNDPLGGMQMSKAEMHGLPLTPEQQMQRGVAINQDFLARQKAAETAANARVAARDKLVAEYNDTSAARRQEALWRQEHAQKAGVQAQKEIRDLVEQPLQKVKPRPLFGNSSAGNQILGAIAVALGQFGANVQGGGPNMALQQLNKGIDDDLDVQREQIRQGEVSTRNRLAYWTDRLGSSESGETAARLELQEAAKAQAQASQLAYDNEETKAALGEFTTQLDTLKMQQLQALSDDRRNRIVADYAPPKVPMVGPMSIGDNSPLWHDERLRSRAAQEFMSLKPNEQHKQLEALDGDLKNADGFQKKITELAEAYGGSFDSDGHIVDKGNVTSDDGERRVEQFDPGFAGVGTNFNPTNWVNTRRDDRIEKKWGELAGMRRMQWKTEPNSAKWQELLTQLDKPVADADTKQALERLYLQGQEMRATVERSASPQAMAYMSYRDPSLMGKMRGRGRRVQGRVGGGNMTGSGNSGNDDQGGGY